MADHGRILVTFKAWDLLELQDHSLDKMKGSRTVYFTSNWIFFFSYIVKSTKGIEQAKYACTCSILSYMINTVFLSYQLFLEVRHLSTGIYTCAWSSSTKTKLEHRGKPERKFVALHFCLPSKNEMGLICNNTIFLKGCWHCVCKRIKIHKRQLIFQMDRGCYLFTKTLSWFVLDRLTSQKWIFIFSWKRNKYRV